MNTACYIINRAMLRPILNKTPSELLRGNPSNISHLGVFGCKCYVHNNGKDNLGKFDARSDEATFLGYSSSSNAYKVLNQRTKRIEESIHVVFDEKNGCVFAPLFENPFPESTFDLVPLQEGISTLNPEAPLFTFSNITLESDSDDELPPKRHSAPSATSTLQIQVAEDHIDEESDSTPLLTDDEGLFCSSFAQFLPFCSSSRT